MAKIEQFKCDGCGKLKGETNHWWAVGILPQNIALAVEMQIIPVPPLNVRPVIVVAPHAGEMDMRYVRHDFCGQRCALEFISAQMAGGKG